jgi:hypothetical protein
MASWLELRRHDGQRVSRAWFVVLQEAERKGVRFTVTSGKRTLAEQRALFSRNMHLVNGKWVPKPGRPLTAFPSLTAPHIRRGNPAHALDVNSLDGGETRLQAWLEKRGVDVSNPVRGETWHMEVSRWQLLRLAMSILRQREKAEKERKRKRREKRERKRAQRKKTVARKHGAQFADIIWDACQTRDIPYALGLALIQKESDFLNQYGHDALPGKPPIWHGKTGRVMVTEENVKDYLRFARLSGLRQGVGPAQLTSAGYQDVAEKRGGLHKPEVTIPLGIEILDGHIAVLGTRRGIGAFNGGRGNPQLDYADDVIELWQEWAGRL